MADADRDDYTTPTLMVSARGTYAQSIRAQLHRIGAYDLPANGVFILAGIDAAGGPRQDFPAELGVTKQAVSQAIDVLVNRGYLTRRTDPGDRRRVVLELTGRGEEVVDAALGGIEAVDRQLRERVSAEQIGAMRAALIALTEIKGEAAATGAGKRRPERELRRFSPVFPVRDLAAALAHYAALGFRTFAYEGGELRVRHPGRGRPAPGRAVRARPAPGRRLPVRARRRRAVRGMDPPRRGGPHPPGRADGLQAARGLTHRSGRQPHPLRLTHTGGDEVTRRLNHAARSALALAGVAALLAGCGGGGSSATTTTSTAPATAGTATAGTATAGTAGPATSGLGAVLPRDVIAAPVRIAHTAAGPVGYREVGAGSPLLLVMGLGGSIDDWQPYLVATLAAHHTVVVFDNAGVGQTAALASPLTITAMANQASALISALRLGRPAVLGWSMGGMIAQALAVLHPAQVSRLILAATQAGTGTARPVPAAAAAAVVSSNPATVLSVLFPRERGRRRRPTSWGSCATRTSTRPRAPSSPNRRQPSGSGSRGMTPPDAGWARSGFPRWWPTGPWTRSIRSPTQGNSPRWYRARNCCCTQGPDTPSCSRTRPASSPRCRAS